MIDPNIVDRVIVLNLESGLDYTNNTLKRGFPIGLDCEIVRFEVLAEACALRDPDELKHATPFIYNRPERY